MDKTTSTELQKLIDSFDRPGLDPAASDTERVAAYRRETDESLVVEGVAPGLAAATRVEKLAAGGVPSAWVLAEGADPDLRLLFIHGGAFIAGTLAGYRHQLEALSRATGMAVLAVDYRLAPEHPYPAGLNDCVAAWVWMGNNGPAGKAVPKRLFLAGDSAGGNLALALLLRLRDEKRRLPTAAAAFSPFTDFTASSPAWRERAHLDPAIDPAMLPWIAGLYVTDGTPLTHPYLSPLFGDFAGLPPFLVHAGEREVMHDDGKLVVEKARQAGIDAHFKTLPGLIHTTEYWCHFVPEGLASLNEVGAFLRSYV